MLAHELRAINNTDGCTSAKDFGVSLDKMFLTSLKNRLIDDRLRPVRILLGPFRGAIIWMSLRDSLRKVFGVYEHELNDWIIHALPRVDTVLDVGANDGYFTFGCAAAFRRLGKTGRIVAFEPQPVHCEQLRATTELQASTGPEITVSVEQILVGKEMAVGQLALDALIRRAESPLEPSRTLVKIDVEGAELDVIEGATQWLDRSNLFLIEVHHHDYLKVLRDRFEAAGISLEQINQRPLPFLGREHRQKANCWLVTPLLDRR